MSAHSAGWLAECFGVRKTLYARISGMQNHGFTQHAASMKKGEPKQIAYTRFQYRARHAVFTVEPGVA